MHEHDVHACSARPCMEHSYVHQCVDACRLRARKEHFKCPREDAKVYESGLIWRGMRPMLDFALNKTYPMVGNSVKRDTAAYRRGTMVTTVPDAAPEQRAAQRRKVGNPAEPWEQCTAPRTPPGTYPVWRTPESYDIAFYGDEFSVHQCRDAKGIGRIVLVGKDDYLPTFINPDCNKSECHPQSSKQTYYLLAGPPGVILCVLMRTGTVLWYSGRKRKGTEAILFWYDEIPMLLSAEDLDGQDPKEVRDRMANHTWRVCLASTQCIAHMMDGVMRRLQHQHMCV